MAGVRNVLNKICKVLAYLSMTVTFLLMLITTVDVVLRKVSSYSILGSYEMTEMGMVFLISMGIAYLQTEKGHVRVDMFVQKLPKRGQHFLDGLTTLVSAGVIAIMAYACYIQGASYAASSAGTSVIHIPYAPFVFAIAVSMILFALLLLLDAVSEFSKGLNLAAKEVKEGTIEL